MSIRKIRLKLEQSEQELAEDLAIKALQFFADDPMRLQRFLTLTGLTPQSLRKAAETRDLFPAVLQYLAADEPLLCAFSLLQQINPATIVALSQRLELNRFFPDT